MPAAVAWHGGKVPITADTTVEGTGNAAATADYLARELGLKVGSGGSRIQLSLVPSGKIANPEGYHLRAANGSVLIEASDPRGLFYGAQTLSQLASTDAGARSVPNVEIIDAPRFKWRGLLI